MPVTQKSCPRCGEAKPAFEFYSNRGHKDGLSSYCRPCTLLDRSREWREKHPVAPYVIPAEKACTKCGVTKAMDQFYAAPHARDKRQSQCRACMRAASLSWAKSHPEYHRERQKEYRQRHPDRAADNNLQWRFGVPYGTYAKMLEEQGGKCAICQTTDPGPRLTRFHVDHCHETDVIRGLLCSACNQGIGLLKHSESILLSAAKYLKDYPQINSAITRKSRSKKP